MPAHRIFHILLFMVMFLHLVSSHAGREYFDGHIDLNATSIHKVVSDKTGKNDQRSSDQLLLRIFLEDWDHLTIASTVDIPPITINRLPTFSSISSVRLIL